MDRKDCGFSKYEKDIVSSVRKDGFFITYVSGDGKSSKDSFCYTTGFWHTLNFPEVITFGLPAEACHALYWEIFRQAKSGRDLPFDTRLPDIAGASDVILSLAKEEAKTKYLRSATWFHGHADYPAVQMIWPDADNHFPWEPAFDRDFEGDQPDLTERGWSQLDKPLN